MLLCRCDHIHLRLRQYSSQIVWAVDKAEAGLGTTSAGRKIVRLLLPPFFSLFFFQKKRWRGGRDPRESSHRWQSPSLFFVRDMEGKAQSSKEWSKPRHRLCIESVVFVVHSPSSRLSMGPAYLVCQAGQVGCRTVVEVVRHHSVMFEKHSSTRLEAAQVWRKVFLDCEHCFQRRFFFLCRRTRQVIAVAN